MLSEINFAEVQQRIDDGTVTLAQCRRMGATHKAYGWSCTAPGHWNHEQVNAYREGYAHAL